MDDSQFPSLEIDEVEKTVVVYHHETGKRYRLEAVRGVVGTEQVHYGVQYYMCNDAGAWVRYLNFPPINRDSADSALYAALSYVSDRPQGGKV